ncbi:hypothetical protein Tco_0519229 [Tanacetum coccineum]
MGLWYSKDSGLELIAYSDAYLAWCHDDFKSTSGGIQFLGDKLVSWSSKKQDCTTMSTAKAEYVSLSACCAQVIWMRTQLLDYGYRYTKIPIYCDSKSAIAISYWEQVRNLIVEISSCINFSDEHEVLNLGLVMDLEGASSPPKENCKYSRNSKESSLTGFRSCASHSRYKRISKQTTRIQKPLLEGSEGLEVLALSHTDFSDLFSVLLDAVNFPHMAKPSSVNHLRQFSRFETWALGYQPMTYASESWELENSYGFLLISRREKPLELELVVA